MKFSGQLELLHRRLLKARVLIAATFFLQCTVSFIPYDAMHRIIHSKHRLIRAILSCKGKSSQGQSVFSMNERRPNGGIWKKNIPNLENNGYVKAAKYEMFLKPGSQKRSQAGISRIYDTSVLKNLMAFNSLATLLEALELFVNFPDEGVVTAQQAVAALNHLRRLSKQAGNMETTRVEVCMQIDAMVL